MSLQMLVKKSDFGPGESDDIMTSNIIYDDKMFLQVLLAVRQNGWNLINSISANDPTTSEPQKHFIFQKSVNSNNEVSRQDSADVSITPRSPQSPPPPPPPRRVVSGKDEAAASASDSKTAKANKFKDTLAKLQQTSSALETAQQKPSSPPTTARPPPPPPPAKTPPVVKKLPSIHSKDPHTTLYVDEDGQEYEAHEANAFEGEGMIQPLYLSEMGGGEDDGHASMRAAMGGDEDDDDDEDAMVLDEETGNFRKQTTGEKISNRVMNSFARMRERLVSKQEDAGSGKSAGSGWLTARSGVSPLSAAGGKQQQEASSTKSGASTGSGWLSSFGLGKSTSSRK